MASDTIADEDQLASYNSCPKGDRRVTAAVRGVLVEAATTGMLRYPWPLIREVLADMMEEVLQEFQAEAHVEVGPAPAGGDSEDMRRVRSELAAQIASCTRGAPWTLQRLCEVVLEPRKQYSRFQKLAQALEKLLRVTT
eukprot:CAMPEP_0206148544 /NCGR_PEP_ID=MMETSP1473-20131121/36932_1 /ASSEMBLY_ACC=CAM_ASM_001109 /TAXON_ID=1461547 /ORGANISM="Stichococcus sp, Strain RCC1054" /LENGTH=138 /DNA_ID=CAMNT_0053545913 /DNA_START=159 /DNA_END=571 /DNA_ORIENTATION=+